MIPTVATLRYTILAKTITSPSKPQSVLTLANASSLFHVCVVQIRIQNTHLC